MQSDVASAHLGVSTVGGVYTWDNDPGHTGQNLNEVVLNSGNVNSTQFGKLFSLPVDLWLYAQPLYVQGVSIPGQGVHNVVYAATENNSVYAFDADGLQTTPLWQDIFTNPPTITAFPSSAVNCTNIGSQVGITGTPVIDPNLGVLYVVTALDNNGASFSSCTPLISPLRRRVRRAGDDYGIGFGHGLGKFGGSGYLQSRDGRSKARSAIG